MSSLALKSKKKRTFNCRLIHNFVITWIQHACVSGIQIYFSVVSCAPSFFFSPSLPSLRKERREKVVLGFSVSNLPLPPSLSPPAAAVYLPSVWFLITFFPLTVYLFSPSLSFFFQTTLGLSLSFSSASFPYLSGRLRGQTCSDITLSTILENEPGGIFVISSSSCSGSPHPLYPLLLTPPSPLAVWFMAYWRGKGGLLPFCLGESTILSQEIQITVVLAGALCERIYSITINELTYHITLWLEVISAAPTFCYGLVNGSIALWLWLQRWINPKHTSWQLHKFYPYCEKINSSGGE